MEITYRISGSTALFMKIYAWAIYCFNFLLEIITDWFGIGLFLSPLFMFFSYVVLGFWFKMKNIPIFSGKTGMQFITSAIISLIPVVNILYVRFNQSGLPMPGIVSITSKMILTSQEEDIENAKNAAAGGRNGYQRPSNRPNDEQSHRYIDEGEYEEAE